MLLDRRGEVEGREISELGQHMYTFNGRSTHVSIRIGLSTLIPWCGAVSFPPSPRMAEVPILRGGVVIIDLAPVTSCCADIEGLTAGVGR